MWTPDVSAEGDDVELVAAARAAPEAFGALYERYRDRVYRYLRSRSPTEDDAADLTQQVFLNAFDGLPKYRGGRGRSFASWLFRIAANLSADAHRQKRTSVSWELLAEALQPLGDEDPESWALRRERRARLRELLAGLEPEKRELIRLRFVAELELHEIADVVGKSTSAVHKQITRTLHNLEERFDG